MSLRTNLLGGAALILGACASWSGPSDAAWSSYSNLVGQPVEITFDLFDPPTSVLTVETVCGTLIEVTPSHLLLGPVQGEPRCETIIPAFASSGHVTLRSVEPPRYAVRRAHVGSVTVSVAAGHPVLWVAIVTNESALPPNCMSVGAFSLESEELASKGVNYVVATRSPAGQSPLEGEAFRCPQ